jgi:Mg/Co/Ni transporter MgtE
MNLPEQNWRQAILPTNATIGQVIRNLNQITIKIVLVTNEEGKLEGTISDGDIRRALLKGLDLNSPITNVIHRNAMVVPQELDRELVKQLMVANKIQQIPVIDAGHHVIGLHLWDELNSLVVRLAGWGMQYILPQAWLTLGWMLLRRPIYSTLLAMG